MWFETRWHPTFYAAAAWARRLTRNPRDDRRYVITSTSDAGVKFCVVPTDRTRAWERLVAVFEGGKEVWRRKGVRPDGTEAVAS